MRVFIGALALIVLLGCAVQSAAAAEDYEFVTKWGSYGTARVIESPEDVAVDASGNIYVPDRTTDQVRKFDAAGALVRTWGSTGTGDGQFNDPSGMAFDGVGNIYVVDRYNARVQKFTVDGTFVSRWGGYGSGDGQFDYPSGIAVDSAGTVYVADTGNNRIQTFTTDGEFIASWGSLGSAGGEFDGPMGLVVNSAGNVYVTEMGNDRVQVIDPEGMSLGTWGSSGSGEGQFNAPCGIALDDEGNVYVVDLGNKRIQVFNDWGTLLEKWGTEGAGDGQFDNPSGIAVDSVGTVYVADTNNNRVQTFTADGAFTGSSANWSPLPGGRFNNPAGIAVDAAGLVYVADYSNHRVQKFDANGTFLATWGSEGTGDGQFRYPEGVAVDSEGVVWVTDKVNNRVQRFTSNGTFISTWGTPGTGAGQLAGPGAIAFDTSGHVYIDDSDGEYPRIQKFRTDSTYLTRLNVNTHAWIAVDPTGNVYATDRGTTEDGTTIGVWKFGPGGTLTAIWGERGSGDGQFEHPSGIAVDGAGNVFVVDAYNRRVQKFDANGAFLTKWGSEGTGDGQFYLPWGGIAVDASGNVYVTDQGDASVAGSGNHRVQKFAPVNPATPEPPVAAFSSNVTSGTAPLAVRFTDESTNAPTAWAWEFGDGATSDEQNPVHVYGAAGTFTVNLTATNGAGPNSTSRTVQVSPVPVQANFTWTPGDPVAGEPVRFTDTSTGGPAWWEWTFGDGTAGSTERNPAHTFAGPGNYTVLLSAYYPGSEIGRDAARTVAVSAVSAPPVAAFSANTTSGTAPLAIQFTDESTNAPTAWAWSFGDGGMSTEQNPTHVYTSAGTYTVNLTATNGDGSNSTSWASCVTVTTSSPPVAEFFTNVTRGTHPLAVKFTDVSTNGPTSWAWEFGDGGTSTEQHPVHVYTSTGTFTVTLTASNGDGSGTTARMITVTGPMPDPGPIPEYRFAGAWGSSGFGDGQFNTTDDLALDGAGNVYVVDSGNHRVQKFDSGGRFLLEWGSEGTGDGQFLSPAGIAVARNGSVWVTDEESGRIQMFTPGGAFIAEWAFVPPDFWGIRRPSEIEFDSNGDVYIVGQIGDTGEFVHYTADGSFVFGTGTIPCSGFAIDSAGTIYLASDAYTEIGYGSVGVHVIASNGTSLWSLGMYGTGDGQFSAPTGVAIDVSGNIWVIDAGQNRVHAFDANRTFVTRWGSGGAGDGQFSGPTDIEVDSAGNLYVADSGNHRVQKFAPVTPKSPVAAFSANVTSGPAPLAVLFTDESTNAPTAWAWEFGDGTTSAERDPVHVYTSAGTYTANLTVTNADGSDSTTRNVTVTAFLPPVLTSTLPPTDTDGDGLYDDVNGNGRPDFADVVLYFNQMTWIAGNEPAGCFDYNANGRIDFADVVWLFNHL